LIEERADVLVPGLAILLALFHTFKIESMRYSDGALREGLMYGLEKYFQVDDIRQRTAQALAIQFNIDKAQAHRVEYTALSLFDQVKMWKNRHQVAELRELIKWASLLHEIGIVINHNNVNKHSAYIISNATLAGFDDEQQALLATLMRFHLKGFKKSDLRSTSRYQYRDILTLLRLFRLAVLFNRSRQASVIPADLNLSINQNEWQLQFENGYLNENPLVQADLLDEQKQLAMIDLQLNIE
jgi:exopolyphosphatase